MHPVHWSSRVFIVQLLAPSEVIHSALVKCLCGLETVCLHLQVLCCLGLQLFCMALSHRGLPKPLCLRTRCNTSRGAESEFNIWAFNICGHQTLKFHSYSEFNSVWIWSNSNRRNTSNSFTDQILMESIKTQTHKFRIKKGLCINMYEKIKSCFFRNAFITPESTSCCFPRTL